MNATRTVTELKVFFFNSLLHWMAAYVVFIFLVFMTYFFQLDVSLIYVLYTWVPPLIFNEIRPSPKMSTKFLLWIQSLVKCSILWRGTPLKEKRVDIGSRIGLMNKLPIQNLSLHKLLWNIYFHEENNSTLRFLSQNSMYFIQGSRM